MHTEKISISLPASLIHFIRDYQAAHACKSQSEVLREAIKLLRQKELENCYLAANNEIEADYDGTSSDGLDDETW